MKFLAAGALSGKIRDKVGTMFAKCSPYLPNFRPFVGQKFHPNFALGAFVRKRMIESPPVCSDFKSHDLSRKGEKSFESLLRPYYASL